MKNDEVISTIDKALEKAIKNEWISLNVHIRRDAVARSIFEVIQDAEKEYQETQEKATALSFVQKYFPEQFDEIIKKSTL